MPRWARTPLLPGVHRGAFQPESAILGMRLQRSIRILNVSSRCQFLQESDQFMQTDDYHSPHDIPASRTTPSPGHASIIHCLIASLLGIALAGAVVQQSWAGTAPSGAPGATAGAVNKPFVANCASCHGESATGGFGPSLLHIALSPAALDGIVRHGRRQMPAFAPSTLSDADLQSIYSFLTRSLLKPADLPLSYTIEHALTLVRVVRGLFFFLALSIVINLVEVRRWMNRAGWRETRRHLGEIGWGKSFRTGARALFIEGFGAGAVYRRSRRAWVLHEGLIYVVPVIALISVLLGSYETYRTDLSPTHPLTVLSGLLALVVLAATITVRRRHSMSEQHRRSPFFGVDYVFLELLILAIIAGLVAAFAQWRGDVSWAAAVHLVHLVLVAVLFLVAPSTSFSHAVVVPVLAAITRLNQECVVLGLLPAPPPESGAARVAPLSGTVLEGLDPSLKIAMLNSIHTRA